MPVHAETLFQVFLPLLMAVTPQDTPPANAESLYNTCVKKVFNSGSIL